MSFFTGIFQLLFPDNCSVCGQNLRFSERILCTHCLLDIPRIYIHNKEYNPLEELLWGQIPYTKATSFYNYTKKNPYAVLLHDLKYRGYTNTGIFMGELFAEELVKSGFLQDIDIIIPIPLHKKRQKRRGFNQSEIIAQGISNISGIPIVTDAVTRIVNTKTQTRKSKEQRTQNVANIFEVTDYTHIQNKHILLLDDVITTGATTISCAETIIKQGFVSEISIASLCLARI